MTELVSPGGSLEKIKTAILFGADAVYVGAGKHSLRNFTASLSLPELKEAIQFAHTRGAKIFLALNVYTIDDDYKDIEKYLKQAIKSGVDAIIIADPGLLYLVNNLRDQKTRVHLSTQANVTSSNTAKFWHQQGVSRIVLARESTLAQIKKIKKNCKGLEVEIFIHGAMCMSYSGRCLLSSFLTGRSANRGECTQPCRWPYLLKEKSRPNETFEINEDQNGTYIMNSRDLSLINHIPELMDAKIDSFKIEGRMKSAYYVAMVTKIYQEAINQYKFDKANYKVKTHWTQGLEDVSHRPYTTGFAIPSTKTESTTSSSYIKSYNFCGKVLKYEPETQQATIEVRNRIKAGEPIDILDPFSPTIKSVTPLEFLTEKGDALDTVHNQYTVTIKIPFVVSPNSLLRVKIS